MQFLKLAFCRLQILVTVNNSIRENRCSSVNRAVRAVQIAIIRYSKKHTFMQNMCGYTVPMNIVYLLVSRYDFRNLRDGRNYIRAFVAIKNYTK